MLAKLRCSIFESDQSETCGQKRLSVGVKPQGNRQCESAQIGLRQFVRFSFRDEKIGEGYLAGVFEPKADSVEKVGFIREIAKSIDASDGIVNIGPVPIKSSSGGPMELKNLRPMRRETSTLTFP